MKMADTRDSSHHFQQKEIGLEGSLPRKTLTSTSLSFLPENAQPIDSLFSSSLSCLLKLKIKEMSGLVFGYSIAEYC